MYSNFRDSSERRAYLAAAESERKLMFVPLLYVFLYIWGLARFFVFVYDEKLIYQKNWEWLTALQVSKGNFAPSFLIRILIHCKLTAFTPTKDYSPKHQFFKILSQFTTV